MIHLQLYSNPKYIQINTEDENYLRGLKEYFSEYASGFQFSPAFKSGGWDGKISMFSPSTRTIPYGLFFDFLKYHKKYYNDVNLEIDPKIKEIFSGVEIDYNWNLSLIPRDYQEKAIKKAIEYKCGLIKSPTASGKSLIISYIINSLQENKLSSKALIIVPNVSLIFQFYDDMKDYGIQTEIGKVWAEEKEWNYPITISTWQSLIIDHNEARKSQIKTLNKKLKSTKKKEKKQEISNKIEKLKSKEERIKSIEKTKEMKEVMKSFDTVIIDECHGASAHSIMTLLKEIDATYRIGCTGTLPDETLNLWNIKAFLGPLLCSFSTYELQQKDYIAKCVVNIININYGKNAFDKEKSYNEIKDEIFSLTYRLDIINEIIDNVKEGPILLLVGKVETEGELLKSYLENKEMLGESNKEIMFIHGGIKAKEREKWRQRCINNENIILIATYGTFQQGINIPNLSHVVLAAPFKSKIRVLQSIGRCVRKHISKVNGAQIYDLIDNYKWFKKHGVIRKKYYEEEQFEITENNY